MTPRATARPRRKGTSLAPDGFQERLLATLAASADGVYAVDSHQRIVFWSRVAEQLTGRSSDSALGRFCWEVMQGSQYDGSAFCRRNCPTIVGSRRGQPIPSYDLQVNTHDGKTAWFSMSIIPLRRRRGDSALAVHMFRDVTDRRRAEMLAQATLETVSRFTEPQQEPVIQEQPYPAPAPTLTAREIEVLRLLAQGLSTHQMAQQLGVARTTVRNHIDHVLAKLGVHRRLEAVLYATQNGLI